MCIFIPQDPIFSANTAPTSAVALKFMALRAPRTPIPRLRILFVFLVVLYGWIIISQARKYLTGAPRVVDSISSYTAQHNPFTCSHTCSLVHLFTQVLHFGCRVLKMSKYFLRFICGNPRLRGTFFTIERKCMFGALSSPICSFSSQGSKSP